MENIPYEKLEKMLEDHYCKTKEISTKIIEELKHGSKNYGEVKEKLGRFRTSTMFQYNSKQRYEGLFNVIIKSLEKEMNDLPLTNRSE